jgi:hypothetical protein
VVERADIGQFFMATATSTIPATIGKEARVRVPRDLALLALTGVDDVARRHGDDVEVQPPEDGGERG